MPDSPFRTADEPARIAQARSDADRSAGSPDLSFGVNWRDPSSSIRRFLLVTSVLLIGSLAASAQPPESDNQDSASLTDWSEPQDLLQNELRTCWKHFSSVDNTPLPSVWQRIDGTDRTVTELICTGDPRGFLYTNQQFGEFELNLEWRYVSDPNGNSGILVYTQNDPRLWPTSVQIQLHQPEAGSVFPSGDAVTDQTVRKEGLARPVGEWNKCRILSRSGRVLVHINGEKAAEVTGCKPAKGCIAIQAEGSEVRFRRILVRTPAAAPKPETPAPTTSDDESAPSPSE